MTVPAIGGGPDVRRHNLAVLLGHLHLGGPMRRSELTDLMGLNRSTIAALVADLVALGVVQQDRPEGGQPAVGRPSMVVRPRAGAAQVLAVDVAVGGISMALVGLGGEILSRRQRVMDAESPAAVVEVMDELAGALTAPAGGPARRLVGLGVAVPGVVRVSDGNVRFAPNLEWRDEPLGELIAERFGPLPSWVGNDGDLGVLAEHRRGVGRGVQDIVFVQGEVGIGGGLVIGGRALAGAGGYAGELGHMVVRSGGRRCHCGARGCWETEIGTAAVARAIGLDGSPREELTARLTSGDPGLPPALEDLARYLAIGLANIVNLLNPGLIVLGGMLQHVYPLVADRVDAAVRGTALRAPAEQVTLAVPGLGGDSVLLGAAELAWQEMLADPVGVLGPR